MRKSTALFVAVALICAPCFAFDLKLNADEQATCDAEGGCGVVSQKALKEVEQHFYGRGYEQCKTDYLNRT